MFVTPTKTLFLHTESLQEHGEVTFRQTTNSVTFKFPDTTPAIENSTMRNNNVPDPSRHINGYHEVNKICSLQEDPFRPRTISEESTDSEDSFYNYIVFETKPDTTNSTIDVDYKETSYEDENEDKENKESTQKVKFNLMPIVHKMVQWNFAYRAARKGPWEEMARDRERFKRRINCIANVLDPILRSQHRAHVWQERFAVKN